MAGTWQGRGGRQLWESVGEHAGAPQPQKGGVLASHLSAPPSSGTSHLQRGARRVAIPLSPPSCLACGSVQASPCGQGARCSPPRGHPARRSSVTSRQGAAIPFPTLHLRVPDRQREWAGALARGFSQAIGVTTALAVCFRPPDATEGNGAGGPPKGCAPLRGTAAGALSQRGIWAPEGEVLAGQEVRKQRGWSAQAAVSSGLSVCFVGVSQPSSRPRPAPPRRRRQLTRSVQSSRSSVAPSGHAMPFCRPRHTLRAVSMTSAPRVAARSSSAMTWGPTPQPVLRRALLWETGVLALSVVSVLLISFVPRFKE